MYYYVIQTHLPYQNAEQTILTTNITIVLVCLKHILEEYTALQYIVDCYAKLLYLLLYFEKKKILYLLKILLFTSIMCLVNIFLFYSR